MGLKDKLKTLDSHSTVSSEFRVYSIQGAVLSILTLTGKWFILWSAQLGSTL